MTTRYGMTKRTFYNYGNRVHIVPERYGRALCGADASCMNRGVRIPDERNVCQKCRKLEVPGAN